MNIRTITTVFLAGLALLCASLDAQAQSRELTAVETQSAYRAVVRQLKTEVLGDQDPNHISLQMADLYSIHPAPIEETSITPGWRGSIVVRITVESNNYVGVPLKRQFRFRVWGAPQDPLVAINYSTKCLSCFEVIVQPLSFEGGGNAAIVEIRSQATQTGRRAYGLDI